MFIPTLEKKFPDILNEILSHNSQQQPLNSNENRFMPHRIREQYNIIRRGMNNRTRALKIICPMMTHPNMANRFHHFLHSTPETPNADHENDHFRNNTYQATQTRGYAQYTTPFRITNTLHEQQGYFYRGSSRLNGSLYGTFPCEYYNHGSHNSNIIVNHPEAIPCGQARGKMYDSSLLLSVSRAQTIIQAALYSVENLNGTKGKFKA